MKHLRLLGTILAAIFAVTAIAAATAAFAENPELLSTSFPVTFAGTGGKASLNSSASVITSTSTKIAGEFTSSREGKVNIDFLGTESLGVKCNSTGDEKGTILVPNAGAHLVDILPSGVLTPGIAITPATVIIKCGTVAIEVLGTAIGQIDGTTEGGSIPPTVKKSILFHSTKPTTGTVQLFKTCDLDKAFCEGKTYSLLANFGTGFKEAAQEQEAEISFNKTISIDY